MRIILLFVGFAMLFVHHYIQPISVEGQFLAFATGILFLGIPHGAADLLVANQNANSEKKRFSMLFFFTNYLGRLVGFGAILWFFPLIGNILFIFLAAYHFGETDLHRFRTDTLWGKILVMNYGLVILSIILMPNFNEVRPILLLFKAGSDNLAFINWLDSHRIGLILSAVFLFLVSVIIYFRKNKELAFSENRYFSIQFLLILVILYNLPMVLGFTFYFVIWHSTLSLKNITSYLRKNSNFNTANRVIRQIVFYSLLAIGGILIFGFTGFMFINNNAIMAYSFLGLAVLTAPHMQVMHDMYHKIRLNRNA
ncbi:MAG: Brp/Blh family beta-carotene 15,15'-dioxygenase [Emticicia sp.]|uniref:Brp/Blh family beta-carotene 15,15'-dioxygenase n=1 Tax=Emticicia sp. TaxID=1930953 RepID=UPI003BA584B0